MVKLTETQVACLAWLADDTAEFGCPGGRRTLHALRDRSLASVNVNEARWEITEAGRAALQEAGR